MSSPRPAEAACLAAVEKAITNTVKTATGATRQELRFQVLEGVSARLGGFALRDFHRAFGIRCLMSTSRLMDLAGPVATAIHQTSIHPALALSALARETLRENVRKSTGAYHTDFRLATRLAQLASPGLTYKSKVIDPASGAGILLVALTQEVCGMDRAKAARWLRYGVHAADLSANALRGSLLSLASFTDDIDALREMRARWYCGDSLLAERHIWERCAPDGFDAVIANPPWEKLKVSKHEFLVSSGAQRHYGSSIVGLNEEHFSALRSQVSSYARRLLLRYPVLRSGEPDLYIAFTDLCLDLCKKGGVVSALLPGGLIRSQGTRAVREKLFKECQGISVSVIDNRARFFSIDTRFKFLAVSMTKSGSQGGKKQPIHLLHERGTQTGMEITSHARIGRSAVVAIRRDLSLPEVRSADEWKLFSKISESGVSWDAAGYAWNPKFCREVDMTKERPKFLGGRSPMALPVIEGRMIQAHRFGAKGYVSGSGRSASWQMFPIGNSQVRPQFSIRRSDVPAGSRHRLDVLRAGFCDIAGQTNERSLMAALVPAGVVCGNKVPTILFPDDPSEDRLLVWVAIANSFVFDWMLRRVLTTTVNYFLLQSVPLPKLAKGGLPWQKLANASRTLRNLDSSGRDPRTIEQIARLRGDIDAEVAIAYGLSLEEMEQILADFPLLDRGQRALEGEVRSTITRDTALAALARRTHVGFTGWEQRMNEARKLGASAYVPSELALGRDLMDSSAAQVHGQY